MVGTGSLAACGGGDDSDAVSDALSDDETAQALGAKRDGPASTQVVSDAPVATTAVALPVSTGGMQFTVMGGQPWLSVRTGNIRAVPFALGFAFKRGDVPAGSTVLGNRGPLQVTPLCKRFLWVPALNGFVIQANSNNGLYFMRMG